MASYNHYPHHYDFLNVFRFHGGRNNACGGNQKIHLYPYARGSDDNNE